MLITNKLFIIKHFQKHKLLIISAGLLLLFSFIVFFKTAAVYTSIEITSLWVREWFGSFYLWLGLGCVLFLILLAVSPLGSYKLGSPDDKPEHSRWAWFTMLYSAGMGAGILLRAVQEPVYMFQHPPIQTGNTANRIALEYTFYQWGFTAWAFYGLFALIIGYYVFNQKQKVLVSSSINTSEKTKKFTGIIDVLTILTTIFGLVGAVGLGTTQITGGLKHLTHLNLGINTTIFITILISLLAFISVWNGVNKGIKIISKLNMLVTIALLIFVFVQTNILHILETFLVTTYHYLIDFLPMSIAYGNYNPGKAFLTDWTYYYWAFWLAWAPFTGIFIARISKGRTIRELLFGVLIIPSLGTFIWFTVFGESAFHLINSWGTYNNEFGNVFTSIFVFFQHYPLHKFINGVTIFLLISFLVTSVDSAIYVLSMFTDEGKQHPNKKHRLLWSVLFLIFAVALLILGSAKPDIDMLTALQKLLIITSLPFAFFTVYIAFKFLYDLLRK
ncbi:BCCT family transporter [Zhouia sp. PK063]|uniref:BCCT family transporter n=1 Tax=Zhouia sp. PK063 TaxID=3373602 RepID=UPI0037899387